MGGHPGRGDAARLRAISQVLGNYLLGEAIDAGRCDLTVHGHAHAGHEKGTTLGGVRLRNVAQSVIRAAYAVYDVWPAHAGVGASAGLVGL